MRMLWINPHHYPLSPFVETCQRQATMHQCRPLTRSGHPGKLANVVIRLIPFSVYHVSLLLLVSKQYVDLALINLYYKSLLNRCYARKTTNNNILLQFTKTRLNFFKPKTKLMRALQSGCSTQNPSSPIGPRNGR